jgi:hypothetical protein
LTLILISECSEDLNDAAALEAMEWMEDQEHGAYENITKRADLLFNFYPKEISDTLPISGTFAHQEG